MAKMQRLGLLCSDLGQCFFRRTPVRTKPSVGYHGIQPVRNVDYVSTPKAKDQARAFGQMVGGEFDKRQKRKAKNENDHNDSYGRCIAGNYGIGHWSRSGSHVSHGIVGICGRSQHGRSMPPCRLWEQSECIRGRPLCRSAIRHGRRRQAMQPLEKFVLRQRLGRILQRNRIIRLSDNT